MLDTAAWSFLCILYVNQVTLGRSIIETHFTLTLTKKSDIHEIDFGKSLHLFTNSGKFMEDQYSNIRSDRQYTVCRYWITVFSVSHGCQLDQLHIIFIVSLFVNGSSLAVLYIFIFWVLCNLKAHLGTDFAKQLRLQMQRYEALVHACPSTQKD